MGARTSDRGPGRGAASRPTGLATVLVTHYLEEPPTTTTHAMLVKHGRVHASGVARCGRRTSQPA